MIDHLPIRRSVFNIISNHPARLPATFNGLCDQFLPCYRNKIRSAISSLIQFGWVQEVSHQNYLGTGQHRSPTSASLIYNALVNKYNVGDEVKSKEVVALGKDLGLKSSTSDSAINALCDSGYATRIVRGVFRIESEVPDVPTLNELGSLLPPHVIVWDATHNFIPTKPEDLAEVLSSDDVSYDDIIKAIDDLETRGCIVGVSSGSSEDDMTFDGYIRDKIYVPSHEELVYYSFDNDVKFSPKDAKRATKLNSSQLQYAFTKLTKYGLLSRHGRGVYQTLPLSNLQGVRQLSEEALEDLISRSVDQFTGATTQEVVEVAQEVVEVVEETQEVAQEVVEETQEVEPVPTQTRLDFERIARQYNQVLCDRESFYDEIELKYEEVKQLRQQAQQYIDNADRIEATYITRKQELDQALTDVKKALTPFVS